MGNSILVVEDEPIIANLLQAELKAEGYRVTAVYDGYAGLEAARGAAFNLILLDWMLPGITGIDICKRIRKRDQTTPIVFLTSQTEISDRIIGLDAGADDYVVKPFSVDELLARVRCNLRRTLALASKETLEYGNLKLDRYQRLAFRDRHEIELTTKEFNLLEHFLLHPGKVLTRKHILEQVWNWEYWGDDSVVETYIRRLRKKLEEHSQCRLIHTVHSVGYVMRMASNQ